MPGSDWFRRQHESDKTSGVPKRLTKRGMALTAGGAALVLGAGVIIVAFASPGSHASLVSTDGPAGASKPLQPAAALHLVSVTPAAGAKNVIGTRSIRVRFSAPLAANSPMPTLSPSIAGHWAAQGDTAVFTPTVGFMGSTKVTVQIPGGLAGVQSAAGALAGNGGTLGSDLSRSFTTASFSTLRLQELLAQLGYLPLTWKSASGPVTTPASARAELSAAYTAPAGTFTWQSGYPWSLTHQWQAGSANILQVGAIRAFESVHNLTMDGYPGSALWSDLFTALAKGQQDPNGYSYALVSQDSPETLNLWHNGHVVLTTLVNTGIPASPTVDGTFPVYLRFYFSYMQGTNPDGSQYDDPVYFANYFNGGDAVHQFDRGGYGYYQSLGCVELPWDAAKTAYSYLSYGSLVTVTGPVA